MHFPTLLIIASTLLSSAYSAPLLKTRSLKEGLNLYARSDAEYDRVELFSRQPQQGSTSRTKRKASTSPEPRRRLRPKAKEPEVPEIVFHNTFSSSVSNNQEEWYPKPFAPKALTEPNVKRLRSGIRRRVGEPDLPTPPTVVAEHISQSRKSTKKDALQQWPSLHAEPILPAGSSSTNTPRQLQTPAQQLLEPSWPTQAPQYSLHSRKPSGLTQDQQDQHLSPDMGWLTGRGGHIVPFYKSYELENALKEKPKNPPNSHHRP